MKVEDGRGSGRLAEVNRDHQLVTLGYQQSVLHLVSEDSGKAFYLATQDFTALTTADTEKAVFFIKNDEATNLYLVNLRTCGTAEQKWRLYKNPTSMSNSTAKTPISLNYGSSAVFTGDVQEGGESSALTGGEVHTQWINKAGHSVQDLLNALILAPGDSLGLTVEVDAAADVCVNLLGYLTASS